LGGPPKVAAKAGASEADELGLGGPPKEEDEKTDEEKAGEKAKAKAKKPKCVADPELGISCGKPTKKKLEWLDGPDGVVADNGSSGKKFSLCNGSNEGRCYDPIFWPGFPSVPAKPKGPLGPGNGDSQSLQIE